MSSKDSESTRARPIASVRFYGGLNDHIPLRQRFTDITVQTDEATTVGELLNRSGVPAAEVALVLRNSTPAWFDDHVIAGDRLSVYPAFRSIDIAPLIRNAPLLPRQDGG
jgi:sulfur carrier protein ThiS